MNTDEHSNKVPSKRASVPWWIGFVAALIVWELSPWFISLLTPRYGWAAGRPGPWNLLGLVPVLVGTIGLLWTMSLHFVQSPQGIEWELDKSYLLMRGPYAFSRHPMYFSELTLMFGWAIFYGSIAVLIAFLIACGVFNFFAAPLEERTLEGHFGEAYREYKKKVPRWLGKIRG